MCFLCAWEANAVLFVCLFTCVTSMKRWEKWMLLSHSVKLSILLTCAYKKLKNKNNFLGFNDFALYISAYFSRCIHLQEPFFLLITIFLPEVCVSADTKQQFNTSALKKIHNLKMLWKCWKLNKLFTFYKCWLLMQQNNLHAGVQLLLLINKPP